MSHKLVPYALIPACVMTSIFYIILMQDRIPPEVWAILKIVGVLVVIVVVTALFPSKRAPVIPQPEPRPTSQFSQVDIDNPYVYVYATDADPLGNGRVLFERKTDFARIVLDYNGPAVVISEIDEQGNEQILDTIKASGASNWVSRWAVSQ